MLAETGAVSGQFWQKVCDQDDVLRACFAFRTFSEGVFPKGQHLFTIDRVLNRFAQFGRAAST